MKVQRIRLMFRNGRLEPINRKLIPEYEAQVRERRVRRAGAKLARIDYVKFRPSRWSRSDLGTMAKIPDALMEAYLEAYRRISRGRS